MATKSMKEANDVVIDSLKRGMRPISPSPTDWRDQFIYFLLVDRFNDGNKNTPPVRSSWDDRGYLAESDSDKFGRFSVAGVI